MRSAVMTKVARIEQTLGLHCPACAGRPALGVVFDYQGRLTDGDGNDVDPA
jgi:hypothetical protein